MSEEALPSAWGLLRQRDYVRFWSSRWLGSLGSQHPERHHGLAGLCALPPHPRCRPLGLQCQPDRPDHLRAPVPARPSRRRDAPTGTTGAACCCSAMPARSPSVGVLAWASLTGHASVPLLLGLAALVFGVATRLLLAGDDRAGADAGPPRHCCRGRSPGTPWPGSPPRSPARRWPACWSPSRPAPAYVVTLALYVAGGDLPCSSSAATPDPRSSPVRAWSWSRRAWPTSVPTRSCWGRSRWTSRLCSWAAPRPCCRPSPATCSMSARRASASCARRRPLGATVVGLYPRLPSDPPAAPGVIMFAGVGVFGAATVVFGLSKLLWLSRRRPGGRWAAPTC